MSKYHKRVLTYDDKSQMYKVSVPELGIEVTSDTEMSALLEARDEVAKAATRVVAPVPQDPFWDTLDLKDMLGLLDGWTQASDGTWTYSGPQPQSLPMIVWEEDEH